MMELNDTNANANANANDNDNRPLLIFNHNPKAGGGSILQVLRGFKTKEIKCKKGVYNVGVGTNQTQTISGCKAGQWDKINNNDNNNDHENLNNTFVNMAEFATTTSDDRGRGFVIGSIREPCSHYVSLWSFGSIGNGRFRKSKVRAEELYGISPPYFNTTEDIQRFRAWMKHKSVVGEVGRRVKASYGNDVVDSVDCWVFIENFRESLLHCLGEYEAQGGYVDWTASTVSSLLHLRKEEEEDTNNLHRRRGLRLLEQDDDEQQERHFTPAKDDPLGDPRLKHHGSCGIFFDANTSQQVESLSVDGSDENGTENFIYQIFGYEGCCRPGNNYFARSSHSSNYYTLDGDTTLVVEGGNATPTSIHKNTTTATATAKATRSSTGGSIDFNSRDSSSPNSIKTVHINISSTEEATPSADHFELDNSYAMVATVTMLIVVIISLCRIVTRFISKIRRRTDTS